MDKQQVVNGIGMNIREETVLWSVDFFCKEFTPFYTICHHIMYFWNNKKPLALTKGFNLGFNFIYRVEAVVPRVCLSALGSTLE